MKLPTLPEVSKALAAAGAGVVAAAAAGLISQSEAVAVGGWITTVVAVVGVLAAPRNKTRAEVEAKRAAKSLPQAPHLHS